MTKRKSHTPFRLVPKSTTLDDLERPICILLQWRRHRRKWGQHYYTVLFSPLSPFQWPQNIWPWMTLTGYLALNSIFAPVWLAETARLRKIIAWKLIKIDTYCQQCKSPAWSLVSGGIRFVRIFGRVLKKGDLKGQWSRSRVNNCWSYHKKIVGVFLAHSVSDTWDS